MQAPPPAPPAPPAIVLPAPRTLPGTPPSRPLLQAPQGREATFKGRNGLELKGTVLQAPGPWFAVLVADAGPMDRDWSQPRLARSHGGRDFALWLQGRGIGSLRFDKRFVGSQDPGLDVSLDAQLGDILAACQAAKLLPEAKGRKVLLAGLGEGALLGLMAAPEADALLLMGLPPQSLAWTILGQVTRKLKADRSQTASLYLQSVFKAIRERRPAPRPGPGVPPALAKLGEGLMAPETLDFVRDTLDLDPWSMVGRIVVPAALLWGDRDIIARPPSRIPPGYGGAILEIPGANHFLKREGRPLDSLTEATALSACEDDTPLADLTLLAEWLKGLEAPKRK